jgi:predicted Rossmann-fold nucleotide-binding protein
MAKRNITLVYGGATVGFIGAVADAALNAGGKVIGILPKALVPMPGRFLRQFLTG